MRSEPVSEIKDLWEISATEASTNFTSPNPMESFSVGVFALDLDRHLETWENVAFSFKLFSFAPLKWNDGAKVDTNNAAVNAYCSICKKEVFIIPFSFTDAEKDRETRPDTRPSVADGWAGAEMRVLPLFDSIITDRRTDGQSLL